VLNIKQHTVNGSTWLVYKAVPKGKICKPSSPTNQQQQPSHHQQQQGLVNNPNNFGVINDGGSGRAGGPIRNRRG
jgi:hypothetical protein